MSETIPLPAEPRDRLGKGGARAARRAGRLPAVIYGDRQEPLAVTIDAKAIEKEIHSPAFFSHVFEIDIGGARQRVLARDVQTDPVTDAPLHVDFLRVSARSTVAVDVPVVIVGEDVCPGVKLGGAVNTIHHSLELVCRADNIPESVAVDISALEMGDVIHARDIPLPAGVELGAVDPESAVVSIAAPRVERAPAEAEEEAAEAAAEAPARGES